MVDFLVCRFPLLLVLALNLLTFEALAQHDAGAEAADERTSVDRALEQRLVQAYSLVPGLEAVRVRARAGVVALEGRVTSPKARTAAEQIAGKQPAVVYVSNRLDVSEGAAQQEASVERTEHDQEIEERLRAVFSHVDDLEQVDVTVGSGVVRLEGVTPSSEARDKAERLATKMQGVIYVDNDIEETREVGERVEPALERLRDFWRVTLARLPLFAVALGVIVVLGLAARMVGSSDRLWSRLVQNRMLRGIVRQLIATGLVITGIVIALELVEAAALVGAVLGAAGLLGIAVGLAFRDIGENYLTSVLLGLRRPFEVNDHVVIGDREGKVVRLTTRETILISLDGNHVRLPNAHVFKSVIVNYTRNPLRRLCVEAGIGATEDLMAAQHVGVEALRATPGVVSEPAAFSRVEQLGDSNVLVRFFAWIDQRHADWFKVRSEGVRRVKAALDRAGIALPVPIYRIETDGVVRSRQTAAQELEHAPCDVGVDEVIERQVDQEAARAPEENLLDQKAR